ncbi:hypothetical protein NFI96_020748, partial [Prochilodus magdalenae]
MAPSEPHWILHAWVLFIALLHRGTSAFHIYLWDGVLRCSLVLRTRTRLKVNCDGVGFPSPPVFCLLPAPHNLTIVSFNLEHKLFWTPGLGTPAYARFRVQNYRNRKNSWLPVLNCSDLSAGESCDLTTTFKNSFYYSSARVQAFTPDQESNWTTSKLFNPLTDTTLGPAVVELTGCGTCLVLKLSPPASRAPRKLELFFSHFIVNVSRTRDKTQHDARDGPSENDEASARRSSSRYGLTPSTHHRLRLHSISSTDPTGHSSCVVQPSADGAALTGGLMEDTTAHWRSVMVVLGQTGTEFVIRASSGENLINYLEPGAEYCVTVIPVTNLMNPVVPSGPHCSYTSPAPVSTASAVPGGLSVASVHDLESHSSTLQVRLCRRSPEEAADVWEVLTGE